MYFFCPFRGGEMDTHLRSFVEEDLASGGRLIVMIGRATECRLGRYGRAFMVSSPSTMAISESARVSVDAFCKQIERHTFWSGASGVLGKPSRLNSSFSRSTRAVAAPVAEISLQSDSGSTSPNDDSLRLVGWWMFLLSAISADVVLDGPVRLGKVRSFFETGRRLVF
jgi:hypothetical protein